jgi:hypothetical protein
MFGSIQLPVTFHTVLTLDCKLKPSKKDLARFRWNIVPFPYIVDF